MSTNESSDGDSLQWGSRQSQADQPRRESRTHRDADDRPDSVPDKPNFRRDDWWGEPNVEHAGTRHSTTGADWQQAEQINDKARYTTFQILRDVAPKLCGASIDDPGKTPVELTEPCVRPHGQGNRQHLRDARLNERDGFISGGESTGVRLGDVDDETFWNAVELLMGYWVENPEVPFDSGDTSDLMVDAQRMRADPDKKDAETIERLAKTALTPDSDRDN